MKNSELRDVKNSNITSVKYVVSYSAGQYEDTISGPIAVFDTEEKAKEFIEKEKAWQRRMEKLAIKNKEPWMYEEDEEGDFDKLEEGYRKWIWDKVIGDKPEKEITEEEYEALDNCMEDEWFPKYMKELGYEDDIIEATMIVNTRDDWSRYHYSYHITETTYYPST